MSSVSIDDGVTVLECDITKTYTLEKIRCASLKSNCTIT